MPGDFNPNDHLTQIKGKGGPSDYLEVKWRLAWFRDQYPDGTIQTELVELTDQRAVFKAKVIKYTGPGPEEPGGMATGYGSETPRDFGDYIEKAETKAVGRALAMLGFGTQFAPELDEGDRIVDAPVKSQDQRRATEPANGTRDTPHSDRPLSDLQRKQMFALMNEIAGKHDWPQTWAKDSIYVHFGIQSTNDLTTKQAGKVIDSLYLVRDKGLSLIDALQQQKG